MRLSLKLNMPRQKKSLLFFKNEGDFSLLQDIELKLMTLASGCFLDRLHPPAVRQGDVLALGKVGQGWDERC